MLYLKNTSWWLRSFTGSLFCSGTSFGPEEVILFPEIGREKILFSLTRIIKFVSEYTFQKKKTRRQKAKETKEEKRISAENLTGFDDIMCVCVCVCVCVCACVCVCVVNGFNITYFFTYVTLSLALTLSNLKFIQTVFIAADKL